MGAARTVLVTGATGLLGSHAAAAVLSEADAHVVAPVRAHHHGTDAVARAVAATGEPALVDADWRERLHPVALPDDLTELDATVATHGVDEIIHCAGCLSYTDAALLMAVNVELTRRLVDAARRWGVARFVHVSTAFAGGYPSGDALITERLHSESAHDPTPYTASKRAAERVVADGAVPYVILRPSSVIGDSATGHYHGPRYGLYQLWSGIERFLLDEWHPEIHFVAPAHPLPILHQDAFRAAVLAARRHLPDGSICHLTSRNGPDVRAIAELFFDEHLRPDVVHYYDRFADVPLDEVPRAQRALLRLAQVNLDIASHHWRFDCTTLATLVAAGTPFVDATLATVHTCQQTYLTGSTRLHRYRTELAARDRAASR
ncbi:MAG: NAD-dependent epimerase/dehydratase family protein [Ilumatobacteraceae bacterium]